MKLHLVVAVTALVALSCATTKLLDSFAEPKDYSGAPFGRLMIVGLAATPQARDQYENAFVDKLSNYGVIGVASINVVPHVHDIDRQTVETWLSKFTLDGVIVTRVTTTKPPRHYVPPHLSLSDWYGSWGMESEVAPRDEKFFLETDLYDARTEELRYSAVLETKMKEDQRSTIRELVDLLGKDMVKRGYFPGR